MKTSNKNMITISLNSETMELINSFLPKNNARIGMFKRVMTDKGAIKNEYENAMASIEYAPEKGITFSLGLDTQFVKDLVEMMVNMIPAFVSIGCACKTWSDRLSDWVRKGIKETPEDVIIEKGDTVTLYYATGTSDVEKTTIVIGENKFNESVERCLEGRGLGRTAVHIPFMNTNVKMEIFVDSITKANDVKLNETPSEIEIPTDRKPDILGLDDTSKFDNLMC